MIVQDLIRLQIQLSQNREAQEIAIKGKLQVLRNPPGRAALFLLGRRKKVGEMYRGIGIEQSLTKSLEMIISHDR